MTTDSKTSKAIEKEEPKTTEHRLEVKKDPYGLDETGPCHVVCKKCNEECDDLFSPFRQNLSIDVTVETVRPSDTQRCGDHYVVKNTKKHRFSIYCNYSQ